MVVKHESEPSIDDWPIAGKPHEPIGRYQPSAFSNQHPIKEFSL
jgi:hypothetical protein